MVRRVLSVFLVCLLVYTIVPSGLLAFAEDQVSVESESTPDESTSGESSTDESATDESTTGESATDGSTEDATDTTTTDENTSGDEATEETVTDEDATNGAESNELANGKYIIRTKLSDSRVIEIADGSKKRGASAVINESDMSTAQQFVFKKDSEGYYTIKNSKSGMMLGVKNAQAKSGADVCQYPANNSLSQKWLLAKEDDGYRISSALSDKLFLDVAGSKNANGTNIQIYKRKSSKAQIFVMLPLQAEVKSTRTVENGRYTITSNLSKKMAVDVPEGSFSNGVQMQIWQSNQTVAQVFDITRHSDGFYSIRSVNSGSYLTVSDNNIVAGTSIVQWKSNNKASQRWAIKENSNGSYTFVAKRSGLVISVAGAKGKSGSKLELGESKGANKAERFTITPTKAEPLVDNSLINLVPYTQKSKVVDVESGSLKGGANVQAWKNNNTMGQKFVVERIAENTYAFVSVNSGLYLTASGNNVCQKSSNKGTLTKSQKWVVNWVYGGFTLTNVASKKNMTIVKSGKSGYNIKVAKASNSKTQVFRYQMPEVLTGGMYLLTTPTGHAIQITKESVNSGKNAQVWKRNATGAQKWRIQSEGNGYYSIRCVRSNRVLDIKGSSTKNNTGVQLWDYNGSKGQLWKGVAAEKDGWIHLQAANGMYLSASNDGNKNGIAVKVTSSPKRALELRLVATSYTGPSGTYADVNLSTQKMIFVKNGVIVLESDVVTGRPGMNTPTGTFKIMHKQSPSVLVGADYRAPVSYWMPFTSAGHGFHDATWQSAFGGNRWKNGFGSHGCVNMPLWAAKILYNNISAGDTVRIHW